MRSLVIAVLVACATPPKPTPIFADPKPLPAATATVATVADLGEATVKAKSHAFFEAYDRHETAAFMADLGPAFVRFGDQRFVDKAVFQKTLDDRNALHAPVHSRVWSDEHVFTGGGAAVFVGHAVVTLPAEGDHAVGTQDGYETLVWVRAGARWQIAHWQWVRAGLDAEREKWNDYFKNSHGFNLKPNQLLVDTVKGRKPGTALDVAMGQGRNAVYLATQGWKVTGVDISDEGMRMAKEAAAAQKLKLDTVTADLDKYDFGKDRWDLVTLIYAGSNADEVQRILPSIKKGGLFVCEYFHADSEVAKTGAGGWATGKLAELFTKAGGFKILRDDVVDDNADWGQRKTKLVRFVAQRL
jgi:SAM-dependent methyltransferase